MDLPIIFCIDDDTQVLRALMRDLKSRYRESYRVLGTNLVQEGLDSLLELKNKGETVAMFISDQRMALATPNYINMPNRVTGMIRICWYWAT